MAVITGSKIRHASSSCAGSASGVGRQEGQEHQTEQVCSCQQSGHWIGASGFGMSLISVPSVNAPTAGAVGTSWHPLARERKPFDDSR